MPQLRETCSNSIVQKKNLSVELRKGGEEKHQYQQQQQSQAHYSRNKSISAIKQTNLWHSIVSIYEFNNVPWLISIRLIN